MRTGNTKSNYYNDAVRFAGIIKELVRYLTQEAPTNKSIRIEQCYVSRDATDKEIYGTEFKLGYMSGTGFILFDDTVISDVRDGEVVSTPLYDRDNALFHKNSSKRRGYSYHKLDDDHEVLTLPEYTEEMLFQLSLLHDETYLFNDILTSALLDAKIRYSIVYKLPTVQGLIRAIPSFNRSDVDFCSTLYQYCTRGEEE